MARLLYSLAFYAAQPLIWLRLAWRARRQPDYLRHLGERYGFPATAAKGRLLWLHAVSVGETRAAAPLIAALLARYPDHCLLLTHMTPTGRETGRLFVDRTPDRVVQAYLPYDLPDAVGRFLDHFRPELGLFMETELWPNLIAAAKSRRIPLALINARLSARSQRGYARFAALSRPAFAALDRVCAQTAADAERLQALGARSPIVTGNLKFDVTPDAALLRQGSDWRQAFGERPVWLVASSRDGEETLVLDALREIGLPGLLLVLVPRHPQRFDEVAALVTTRGLTLKRRSRDELPSADTKVWLGDSMGEMPAYYASADVALIGGSLLPFGGQNLIEAAACGCPVVVGPHTTNFAQAADDAVASGAARRIVGAEALASAVSEILNDGELRRAMKEQAIAFSHAHQGATARTMAAVSALAAPAAPGEAPTAATGR